jgi:site-specific DNA-methyltransferase (adenine-specific)
MRFGFAAPVVVWASRGELRAGHTRLKAVRFLQANRPVYDDDGDLAGWEDRPAHDPFHVPAGRGEDGSYLLAPTPDSVPVRRMEFASRAEADAYGLADNRLAELADWDEEGLKAMLDELSELDTDLDGLGWSDDELAELMGSLGPATPGGASPAPAPPDEPASQLGEVYELGPHRLVCGDSTDATVWDALLRGEQLQVVWTDPPYGVAYVGKTADALTIQNDDLSPDDLRALLASSLGQCFDHSAPGAVWYVAAPAGPLHYEFATVLRELGVWRWTLMWVKDRFVLGRADYHHRHEPIFYGWKPGAAHYFVDDRTQDTIFEVARPGASEMHPTMKPIELVVRQLRNSAKPGWIVGEPFGGSGTTLMAAAQLGMRARLIELDPRYCDVIRRRWTVYAKANDLEPGSGALDDPTG